MTKKSDLTASKGRTEYDVFGVRGAPDASGVYFLYQKADLVYIGKARTSIRSRLMKHDHDKEFDRIRIGLVPAGQCRREEKKEIRAYKKRRGQLPFYNGQS